MFLYGLGLSSTVTPVANVCGKERPCKLYHIETHSRRRITSPYRSIMTSNVFLYGRGAGERSLFYWLKASYFTLKFHPRWFGYLVTVHLDSPCLKMYYSMILICGQSITLITLWVLVACRGYDPLSLDYQSSALPLS